MIRWSGECVLLAVRRHGEAAALVDVLTPDIGRLAGVVRGGGGRRMAAVLQPAATLEGVWTARIDGHLGSFSLEGRRQRLGLVLDDPLALAALGSLCSLLVRVLPERSPVDGLYDASREMLDSLAHPGWAEAYVRWELGLLERLGYGLDLGCCAVTGVTSGLAYVSPRTGRAVSSTAAVGWETRLLPLPKFLTPEACAPTAEDIALALRLTGHFLTAHAITERREGRTLPEGRQRLQGLFDVQRAG